MTYTRACLLEAARIEALTAAGHAAWHAKLVTSSQLQSLRQDADWRASCTPYGAHEDGADMFKITQNTVHRFSLGEILLMAAMNEIEAQRKASAATSSPERTS